MINLGTALETMDQVPVGVMVEPVETNFIERIFQSRFSYLCHFSQTSQTLCQAWFVTGRFVGQNCFERSDLWTCRYLAFTSCIKSFSVGTCCFRICRKIQ